MVLIIPSKLTQKKEKIATPKKTLKNTCSMKIHHPSIHPSIYPSIIPWRLGVRKKAPFPTNQSSQSNNNIPKLSHICNKKKILLKKALGATKVWGSWGGEFGS
jgi:hypothetical protein